MDASYPLMFDCKSWTLAVQRHHEQTLLTGGRNQGAGSDHFNGTSHKDAYVPFRKATTNSPSVS